MSQDNELLRLSDLNLAESQREHARFLSPYAIEERDGILLTAAGTRFPAAPFNVAMRSGDQPVEPARLLADAEAYFSERGRGFSVHARAHLDGDLIEACNKGGMLCLSGRCPGMVLTNRLDNARLNANATCRVIDVAHATDFVTVAAASYEPIGLPAAIAQKLFSMPERWLRPHWHVRVIYDHDEPVAGAMLLFSHGIAGVYWVGTVPSARGKGYAEAIMRDISNHAFDRSARAVVLQASTMGEPVYRRLGYKEITTYPWFLNPPTARASE